MAVRRSLSREIIRASALSIADAEGLDAVTIRRLAAEHAVSAMAIYGHFASKEALLDSVAEFILAGISLKGLDTEVGAAARLTSILTATVTALREHPVLAPLVAARTVDSEAGLRLTEWVMSALLDAGFATRDASESASFLLVAATALASPSPGYRGVIDPDQQESIIRQRRASLGALDPAEFPAIVKSAEDLALCASNESYFARGIELLVHGTLSLAPLTSVSVQRTRTLYG